MFTGDDLSFAGSELTDVDSLNLHIGSLSGGSDKTNVRFHALQNTGREVDPGSLTIGRVHQKGGLHKLDISMGQHQEKINEFYQDDAKSVHGLNVRPSVGEWNSKAEGASMFDQPRNLGRWVQNTKGLANFSSIKLGDNRIQRVSSAYREEYRAPDDRKAYGRPLMDPCFKNVKSTGHLGVGLFTKSFQMADEVMGDESASVGLGSTSRVMNDPVGDKGRALRISMYRKAMQDIGSFNPANPSLLPPVSPVGTARSSSLNKSLRQGGASSEVGGGGGGGGERQRSGSGSGGNGGSGDMGNNNNNDALVVLEGLFRAKLSIKAIKGVGGFHLPAIFAYLDRSGRGGFDLEDFRKVVEVMSLDFNESQTIALFAKYDVGCKGFVSYHDFTMQLGHDPKVDVSEIDRLMIQHTAKMNRNQHLHQSWSADMKLGKSRVTNKVMKEEFGLVSSPTNRDEATAASFERQQGNNIEDSATIATHNTNFEQWIDGVRTSQRK